MYVLLFSPTAGEKQWLCNPLYLACRLTLRLEATSPRISMLEEEVLNQGVLYLWLIHLASWALYHHHHHHLPQAPGKQRH